MPSRKESFAETAGGPDVGIAIRDEGPALADAGDLFVPFFTTNADGIGLTLCRQSAESHDGTLTLEARTDRPGCWARLRLPVGGSAGG